MTIEKGWQIGHSNDGKGVMKPIEKISPLRCLQVVMLGASGAGRPMADDIPWAGAARMTIATRSVSQGREVTEMVRRASCVTTDWQPEVSDPAGTTLFMNATQMGSEPELGHVPVKWDTFDHPACIVVNVITNFRITPFLATALAYGCRVVDGVKMLVQLAMQIFEIGTGVAPADPVFRKSVAVALGERRGRIRMEFRL